MRTLIQPTFVLLLFVLVRASDLAIGRPVRTATGEQTRPRSWVWTLLYGIVAVLALLAVLVILFGI